MFIRAFCSATCAGVAAFSPIPVHGARSSFDPTTCSAAKLTFALRHVTISGKARLTPSMCWGRPFVVLFFTKNVERTAERRSNGLYAPLFGRWQSVHSLSPGV